MATSEKLKDDFLTCHICMEVYQKPVTLDCQHSYCKGCLTKYIKTQTESVKTKSIPCPSCRRHIPVPHPDRPVEEWASQFKTGLVIQGLMDSLVHGSTDTDNCSVCKKKGKTTPATHWCSECEASLCDDCLKLHNIMPKLSQHDVSDLTGETPREQVRKKKFVCKKHDKKIKLFCKDCKKTLCTVCCSVGHRACKDVVEIQEMLPEVKQELESQQKYITDKVLATAKLLNGLKGKTDEFALKIRKVRDEITQSFKAAADFEDKQTGELKAKIKCEEIARQTYQQQSQFIQQALKSEDEAQLYEMYLSSGSGAVVGEREIDSEDRTDVVNISFKPNMEKLRDDIDMMDVITVCEDVIDLTAPPAIDLSAPPVLQNSIHMKVDGGSTNLCDVVVLVRNGTDNIIVTDHDNKTISSAYMKNGTDCSSYLKVTNKPWSLGVLNHNKLVVSRPYTQQMV